MLSKEQEDQLTGEAECFLHFHPKIAQDQRDLREQDSVRSSVPITADATLDENTFFADVDTSAGSVTITMPATGNELEYHITKTTALGVVNIVPAAGETIIGSTAGVTIQYQWTSLHFKAIPGGWKIV